MVAMEAPYDVHAVADAKRIGELMQVAVGDAAFYLVVEIFQQAQKTRRATLEQLSVVHGQLQLAAAHEKSAQGRLDVALPQLVDGRSEERRVGKECRL